MQKTGAPMKQMSSYSQQIPTTVKKATTYSTALNMRAPLRAEVSMMMSNPVNTTSSRNYMGIAPSQSVTAKMSYNKMLATDAKRGTLLRMQAGGAAAMPMPSDPLGNVMGDLDNL